MSKRKRKSNADAVSQEIINFFDSNCRDLSLDEYDEVLESVSYHIETCIQARKEEKLRDGDED